MTQVSNITPLHTHTHTTVTCNTISICVGYGNNFEFLQNPREMMSALKGEIVIHVMSNLTSNVTYTHTHTVNNDNTLILSGAYYITLL